MIIDTELNPELTKEQENIVASLSPESLKEIDRYIISECTGQWRKVARIIGLTFLRFSDLYPNLPDGFYFQRLCLLFKGGELLVRGDLKRMRSCEVRLPSHISRET